MQYATGTAQIWELLPYEIKSSPILSEFEKSLKAWSPNNFPCIYIKLTYQILVIMIQQIHSLWQKIVIFFNCKFLWLIISFPLLCVACGIFEYLVIHIHLSELSSLEVLSYIEEKTTWCSYPNVIKFVEKM